MSHSCMGRIFTVASIGSHEEIFVSSHTSRVQTPAHTAAPRDHGHFLGKFSAYRTVCRRAHARAVGQGSTARERPTAGWNFAESIGRVLRREHRRLQTWGSGLFSCSFAEKNDKTYAATGFPRITPRNCSAFSDRRGFRSVDIGRSCFKCATDIHRAAASIARRNPDRATKSVHRAASIARRRRADARLDALSDEAFFVRLLVQRILFLFRRWIPFVRN